MGNYDNHIATSPVWKKRLAPDPAPPSPPANPEDSMLSGVLGDFMTEHAPFTSAIGQKSLRGLRNVKEGAVQASLQAGESSGLLPEGTVEKYTNQAMELREQFDAEYQRDFGNLVEPFGVSLPDVAQLTAETAPYLAVPGGGATALQRLGLAAGTGAAVGGTQFVKPGESRGLNTSIGGVFGAAAPALTPIASAVGGAVSGVASKLTGGRVGTAIAPDKGVLFNMVGGAADAFIESAPAVRAFLGNKLKGLNTPFAAESRSLTQNTDTTMKLSQETQDPLFESFEQSARQTVEGERLGRGIDNAQLREGHDYWASLVASDAPPAADKVRAAFDDLVGSSSPGTLSGLLGKRKQEADAMFQAADDATPLATPSQMGKLRDIAGAGGGTIEMANTRSVLDRLIKRGAARDSTPQDEAIARQVEKFRKGLDDGAYRPLELQSKLEQWGRVSKGTESAWTDVDRASQSRNGKEIFAALQRDLDVAVERGGPGADELRLARDTYKTNSAAIEEVRQSTLGALLGKKNITDDAIRKKILTIDADSLKEAMRIFGRTDPDFQRALQVHYIDSKLSQASVPGSARTDISNKTVTGAASPDPEISGFSPGRLLDLIRDKKKFDALFPDDSKMGKQVRDGLSMMQRLMTQNERRSASGVMPRTKEAFGTIAGGSPVFLSRLFAEYTGGSLFTWLMFNPRGVQYLRRLASSGGAGGPNQNKIAAVLSQFAMQAKPE